MALKTEKTWRIVVIVLFALVLAMTILSVYDIIPTASQEANFPIFWVFR